MGHSLDSCSNPPATRAAHDSHEDTLNWALINGPPPPRWHQCYCTPFTVSLVPNLPGSKASDTRLEQCKHACAHRQILTPRKHKQTICAHKLIAGRTHALCTLTGLAAGCSGRARLSRYDTKIVHIVTDRATPEWTLELLLSVVTIQCALSA